MDASLGFSAKDKPLGRKFFIYLFISRAVGAVIQLTMTSPKTYDFVLRNTLSQNKHTKVKKYLLLTNEGGKTEK